MTELVRIWLDGVERAAGTGVFDAERSCEVDEVAGLAQFIEHDGLYRSVSRTIRKAGKVDDRASRSKMEKESRTMGDDWSPEFFSSVVEEKFILNFDNLWACLAFR